MGGGADDLISPRAGASAALELVLGGAGYKRHCLHVAVAVRGSPQRLLALVGLLFLLDEMG